MGVLLLFLASAALLPYVTADTISSGSYTGNGPITLNGSYVNMTILGYPMDVAFNPATYRDGGGGGMTGLYFSQLL